MIINKKYTDLSHFKSNFFNSKPFPHLVLDDFIDPEYFSELNRILKNGKIDLGKNFNSEVEKNKSISLNSTLPITLKNVINHLNSEEWLHNLHKLSEIPEIFPVTSDNKVVANYHEITKNGNLAPHVDHSHEPSIKKPHVINIIVYLSDDWKIEYGGNTLFFDKKGKNIEKKIEYKKNRAVIFLHTPYSFHGVEKISENSQVTRKTIYVDYYSNVSQPFENLKYNISKKWFKHGTTFIFPNKSDYFKLKNLNYTKTLIHYKLSELLNIFT